MVAAGICYGCTDVAVAAGERQRILSSLLPALPHQAPLFSSPLQRCAGLAAELAGALGGEPPILDARLQEMNFGYWEMRAWDDIPHAEVDAWAADPARYRPGDGESVLQAAQRVRAFHDELMQLRPDGAIVVCHAGTIRLLLACRQALPATEIALHAARTPHIIAYGKLLVVDYHPA